MHPSQSGVTGGFDLHRERRGRSPVPSRRNWPREPQEFWPEHRVAPPLEPRRAAKRRVANPPKARLTKRVADIVLGAALIVFFTPPMALIALAVCLDGGSPFYGHSRVGPDRQRFRCWKFRTMVVNADQVLQELLARDPLARAEWESSFKLRRDPRITLIGQFLRAFSIDELPQLFNVMRGEMSLVGPRPIVAAEIDRYGSNFSAYCACRPGITGLWQVSGRSDVDYTRRVELDAQYAKTWSLWLDLRILLNTVVVVARRDGAY
jgi:Undecaprenyl-phosphate galactose phosphotransferase WbaP